MVKKKILILYTESQKTKYKEYISLATVSDVQSGLDKLELYDISSTQFVGFTIEFLSYLKEFDLIFNLCYGLYDISRGYDISQDDVIKWLDDNEIKHTTTKYPTHRLAMDKSSYPSITEKINGLLSPKEMPYVLSGEIIKKPKFGSCHRDMSIYNSIDNPEVKDRFDSDKFIYQEYVKGREFSVAVIPDKLTKFKILAPVEIVSEREVFILGVGGGIRANYTPIIEPEVLRNINDCIYQLHENLDLLGITRTDLKLSKNNELYLLDINAMPNIDLRQTFLPSMITQSNMSYNDVLKAIVDGFI